MLGVSVSNSAYSDLLCSKTLTLYVSTMIAALLHKIYYIIVRHPEIYEYPIIMKNIGFIELKPLPMDLECDFTY